MKIDRDANEYVLSLSYGKDSLACLGAIEALGFPLDRIVHAELWATDTIHADFPDMLEFKAKIDKMIKERYGIEVEHLCAMRDGKKLTYEDFFYRVPTRRNGEKASDIMGFPMVRGSWCNSVLKKGALTKQALASPSGKNVIQYLGIAIDEPARVKRHSKRDDVLLPLVEIGWNEERCKQWCEENDMLSPVYTERARGGCWFCHFQGVDQLRTLRREHPDLWELLLEWDEDSPRLFRPEGRTLHEFDRRFILEDEGLVPANRCFRWSMMDFSKNKNI